MRKWADTGQDVAQGLPVRGYPQGEVFDRDQDWFPSMGYIPQVLTHLAQHQYFPGYTLVSLFSFTLDLASFISEMQQIAYVGQQGK